MGRRLNPRMGAAVGVILAAVACGGMEAAPPAPGGGLASGDMASQPDAPSDTAPPSGGAPSDTAPPSGGAALETGPPSDTAPPSGDVASQPGPPSDTAPPVSVGGLAYFPYESVDYGSGACAPADGVDEPVLSFDTPPQLCIDPAGAYLALFDTTRGPVLVLLDAANVPGTVNSFVNLARFGYYDGTAIHRSDPSIGILQGGSPHTNQADDPGPGYRLWDEGIGFSYRPGQLAMARTSDPNSADAQFFFTVTEAAGLLDGQGTYVVFGEVIEGLDVLVDILNSHVGDPSGELSGAPDPAVAINSITIRTGEDIVFSMIGSSPPVSVGGLAYFPYESVDYGSGACAPADGVDEPVLSFDTPPQLCIDPAGAYLALFDTTRGPVLVLLDAANVPGTVNSFVNLARFGYYDGTAIHRSDPSIGILQGGSPHTNQADDPGPGYRLWDEGIGFSYRPGQLAMARTSDPNSADAQFFFTVTEAAGLLDGQGTYVVFGEVIEGLDVLVDILNSHVGDPSGELSGAPDPAVAINSITIESG